MLVLVKQLLENCHKLSRMTRHYPPKLLNINTGCIIKNYPRSYSQGSSLKVAVLGAAGQVGQPLSLMLKQSPHIDELVVYDILGTCGFAMELAHIDTKCKVTAHTGIENIQAALGGSSVIVIVAAAPRTNSQALSAMFEANSIIVRELAENIALYCPKAMVALATNPVNSLVPLFSEVLKANGAYNPLTVFGVTTLNVIRANSIAAEVLGLEPECVAVPVIGGTTEKTIVPVLSQTKPCADFTNEELENITLSIQNAHHEVAAAKAKSQSATLSSAFAIARFVISLVKAIRGQTNIVECAYVRSDSHPNAKYLATPLRLGTGGIQKNLGIPHLSSYEECQLKNAMEMIGKEVSKGELYVGVVDPPPCDPCSPDPKAAPCPPDWCERNKNRKLSD